MIKPLTPYPAAIIKTQKTRTLVIADLHIGWEMALAEKGIHIPTQTPRLLKTLLMLIFKHKPDELLILGDVKHTVAKAELGEWQDVPEFFNELKNHVKEITVIRGNHDGNLEPLLPENIKLLPATAITIGNIGLFHGHRWPPPTLLKCETLVMGHVHPVLAFKDPAGFRVTKQVWIKAKCGVTELAETLLQKHGIKVEKNPEEKLWERYKIKPKTKWLFIMPSFNDSLGGKPLNDTKTRGRMGKEKIIGPVLRSKAVKMDEAEAYLLDGTFLGTLGQLENLG
ncbi:MAG: metallophosphoesterase [Candidatus Bathyarchaeia archaeon]